MDTQILPATAEHLQAISDLAAMIWRAHYPRIISREQIEFMLRQMYSLETMRAELDRGVRYDRLLMDEQLAGFASYGPLTDSSIKLHKFYLHSRWRGLGLGRGLLRHVEAEAQKLGVTKLLLNVNKRNVVAIEFYRRSGFVIRESVIVPIGGGFVMDDYVMVKEPVRPA